MNGSDVNKGMILEVTDGQLLEKTGGIVQGMSGSPIIQDGKLIGAVTHVLVNDPTRGRLQNNRVRQRNKIRCLFLCFLLSMKGKVLVI